MDVVYNLLHVKRFCNHTHEEKVELKNRGRPLPDICIETTGIIRGKPYKRQFNREIYYRNDWICGCNRKNALFCFPCLLFNCGRSWSEVGITDLMHLNETMKKHENSKTHLHNSIELALLGEPNIIAQLDSTYWRDIQEHKDTVTKNRYVLSEIITSIIHCSAFELELRCHDDTYNNPNELINFSTELESILNNKITSIFKENPKEIINNILDCILEVCHEEIIQEINNASFIAIITNETTNISSKTNLVTIFRYTCDGELIERFWKYTPIKYDTQTLTKTILNIIDPLLEKSPTKLISQSYNSTNTCIQDTIKQKYHNAHFVHSYAHQLKLIISKTASKNIDVRVFFRNLKDIPAFFNNSPKHIVVLDIIINKKIPEYNKINWDFNLCEVFEHRESIIECMEQIEENSATVCNAASNIRRMLEDSVFIFWLTFFQHVMPHVDILLNQVQNGTDSTLVKNAMDNFEKSMIQIRNRIDDIITEASNISIGLQGMKRKRSDQCRFDQQVAVLLEVCDIITNAVKDRLNFKDHLVAASLFAPELIGEYCNKFPDTKLISTCLAYPALDKDRLKSELCVMYARNDCRQLKGALPLLKFFIKNKLAVTLKETKKLLEIVVTTPMPTSEAERSCSTFERIENFLHNTMCQDRLTVFTMISVEKKFISDIFGFNERVIEKFTARKDHSVALTYNP